MDKSELGKKLKQELEEQVKNKCKLLNIVNFNISSS